MCRWLLELSAWCAWGRLLSSGGRETWHAMVEPGPILSYRSPQPRRIHPIVWWLIADFVLMLVNLIALFVIEPERAMDPPASPAGEALLAGMAIVWVGLLVGIGIWAMRIWWQGRRVG